MGMGVGIWGCIIRMRSDPDHQVYTASSCLWDIVNIGLAPKLAELEPFKCEEVKRNKILTKFFRSYYTRRF